MNEMSRFTVFTLSTKRITCTNKTNTKYGIYTTL